MFEHLSSLFSGIRHAWRGLLLAFRSERSFRIQIFAALLVMVACILLPLELWERVTVLLVSGLVLVLELVNSMVERLVDLVKPRLHGYVHDIKDLMAAAVFVAACFAALIGFMIFYRHLGDALFRV